MKVLYSKFTRERAPRFQLETSIVEDEQGMKTVQKRALNLSGESHIHNIYENYLRFSQRETSCFLECIYKDNRVIFPYVEGKSLYAKLADALGKRDKECFCSILDEYKTIVKNSIYDVTPYKEEEMFTEIFGRHIFPDHISAARYVDVDLTFDNIIIDQDDKIKIIDYEWMFECLVPINFAVYRAAFAFYLKHGGQMGGIMTEDEFYVYLGITQEEKEIYREMNNSMMSYIMSEDPSYKKYKRKVRFLNEFIREENIFSQIYIDTGNGYSEEESIIYPLKNSELQNEIEIDLDKYENVQAIRFDPLNLPCGINLMDIYAVTEEGRTDIPFTLFISNAVGIYENEIDFLDGDPQMIIEIKKEAQWKRFIIHYEVLFYREKDVISQYGDMEKTLQFLEKENELFLKREYAFKNREEEYRASLSAAISELEQLKETNQMLKDKLRYIEGTSVYRTLLKGKVDKLGLWDKLREENL